MSNQASADNGEDDYEKTLQCIRAGLRGARPDAAGSIAAFTIDLRPEIREARSRGLTFRQIAQIFKANGVQAEPDAIRVALGRNIVTKAARGRRATETLGSTPAEGGKKRTDGAAIVLRVR